MGQRTGRRKLLVEEIQRQEEADRYSKSKSSLLAKQSQRMSWESLKKKKFSFMLAATYEPQNLWLYEDLTCTWVRQACIMLIHLET